MGMSGCLILFGEAIFFFLSIKCVKLGKLHFDKQRFSRLFYEEFHIDLHGSGNFYFLLIDLNRVCIKFIKLAPNVPNSYLLICIHNFSHIYLNNKCYNCVSYVFIHYLLKSL